MLGLIWAFSVVLSSIFAVLNNLDFTLLLSDSLESAIELCLSLAGIMAFWGGFMEIAEKSGITEIFSKILSPIINLIFPKLKNEKGAKKAISMNITANLLGLGNAATPLGIEAMNRLDDINRNSKTASDCMVTFVIINTASVQIIPVTVAALRAKFGSSNPMIILPAVLLASVMSLMVGLIVDRVISLAKRGVL